MLDSEERTPLLVAVLRSSWSAARTLLKLGAEADIPDLGGRNLLHFLVMNSGRVDDLISACSVGQQRVTRQRVFGRSAASDPVSACSVGQQRVTPSLRIR